MAAQLFQLHITLKGSKPKIWRRILVKPDINLVDLHKILQTVMGWSNSHMHVFSDGMKNEWAPKEFEVDYTKDSKKVKLNKIITGEKQHLHYEYDFGDGWEHDIVLEKIVDETPGQKVPVCIGGARKCPPEDCGGIWAYENLLGILSNPRHKEYKDTIEWLGGKIDPEDFEPDEINQQLMQEDYGCIWLDM